jgi:CRP-like cAMP-binding protein
MLSRDRLDQSLIRNQILARTPIEAFAQLAAHLTPVTFKPRAILQERQRRVEQVYFLESGVASIFAWTQQDGPVQVGLVGRLGMVGVSAVLGMARSPHRTLMQTQGEAFALPASELIQAMDAYPRFRVQLLNYVHFLLIQNSQFALCNARHELEARVARWLLLTCDRLDGSIIPVTHDQLSMMLGVRRAGITEALAALEAAGALNRGRGEIEITDRAILEARACECYRIIAAERERRASPDHQCGVGAELAI